MLLVNNVWKNHRRTTDSYNLLNKPIYHLSEVWNGVQWGNEERRTYSYKNDNLFITQINEIWKDEKWVLVGKYETKYNSQRLLTNINEETWIDGNLTDKYILYIEYDMNLRKIKAVTEFWSNIGLNAYNVTTYTYTDFDEIESYKGEYYLDSRKINGMMLFNEYDRFGRLITTTGSYFEQEEEWKPTYLFNYEYDSNGNEILFEAKNFVDNNWADDQRRIQTYDTNNYLSTVAYERWDGFNWIKSRIEEYKHNSEGKEKYYLEANWNDGIFHDSHRIIHEYSNSGSLINYFLDRYIDDHWQEIIKRNYEYDADENLIFGTSEYWNGYWMPGFSNFQYQSNEWNYSWGTDYYQINVHYSKADVADYNTPYEYKLFQNYPNPFNASTEIYFSLPENGNVILNVYDILGRKVKELKNEEMTKGTHKLDFNSAGLSSGVYIYSIQTDNFYQAKKMLLLK